jgi:hypothetical protein
VAKYCRPTSRRGPPVLLLEIGALVAGAVPARERQIQTPKRDPFRKPKSSLASARTTRHPARWPRRRILYFDPDVFWTGSPQRYLDRYGGAQFAAAEYTGDLVPPQFRATGLRYINSGIMLLRPSASEYGELVARWAHRNYTAQVDSAARIELRGRGNAARSKASEQDLLAAHFNDRLVPMDACENFRGYVKPTRRAGRASRRGGQAHCDPSCIIAWHGTRFRGKATCRKPEGKWVYAHSLREWEQQRSSSSSVARTCDQGLLYM